MAATDYEVEQFANAMSLSHTTAAQALAWLEDQGWTPPDIEPGEAQRPGKFADPDEPSFVVEGNHTPEGKPGDRVPCGHERWSITEHCVVMTCPNYVEKHRR